jgi:hypothetical protein
MHVNVNDASAGALMEYFPEESVDVPMELPSRRTKTPGRGIPSSSATFPVTVISCASTYI